MGPLLEQTEDVTIAIALRRWSAWYIRSTFFSAMQEAGSCSTLQRESLFQH